jgi:hypothetical protein
MTKIASHNQKKKDSHKGKSLFLCFCVFVFFIIFFLLLYTTSTRFTIGTSTIGTFVGTAISAVGAVVFSAGVVAVVAVVAGVAAVAGVVTRDGFLARNSMISKVSFLQIGQGQVRVVLWYVLKHSAPKECLQQLVSMVSLFL